MNGKFWLLTGAMMLALPAWAAAPVEERQPGMEPMVNQQQRAAFANTQKERAEQEARVARESVEALSKAVQVAEQELASRRKELEAARQQEAAANQRLQESRKQAEKEMGVLKTIPSGQ